MMRSDRSKRRTTSIIMMMMVVLLLFTLLLSFLACHSASAFTLPSFSATTRTAFINNRRQTLPSSFSFSSSSSFAFSSLHCICIDCKYVTNCKAYHFVETKHEQPHMTNHPTFEPRDGSPTIHVNIRTTTTTTTTQQQNNNNNNNTQGNQEEEDDDDEGNKIIWSEHEQETQKQDQKQQQQQQDKSSPLIGETKYTPPPTTTVTTTTTTTTTTTYEYDVVACADFTLDRGAWIRNMPEEIKKANPNFVPT